MNVIAMVANRADTSCFIRELESMKMRSAVLAVTIVVIAAGVTAKYKLGFEHFGSYRLQAGSAHSVRLSWAPSPSTSVSGYNVYRSEIRGGGYRLLNKNPVVELAYTDESIEAVHIYYYVTTSVDSKGNESKYSKEFKIKIP
jgi:fibronectin type 3 domain-containing protein